MAAQSEHRLGHVLIAKSKKRQAKFFTTAAWLFGIFIAIALVYNYLGLSVIYQKTKTTTENPIASSQPQKSEDKLDLFKLNSELKKETTDAFTAELQDELTKTEQMTTTSTYFAELQFELKQDRAARKDEARPTTAPISLSHVFTFPWHSTDQSKF